MKFNFVEVAIVPGLVMADTGGSGDVSVLSASERMHLMPFAAITNRIGGTLALFPHLIDGADAGPVITRRLRAH